MGLLRTIPTYGPVTSHEIPARRAAIQVVHELPKRTTDDDATTTTRKKYSASHATARVGPPAQRVGGGYGGAVVLAVGRVAFVWCATPRDAQTNLNGSDAAA